jgi:D-alanine-D-alanine ligase-like ATP-grasp enzyme
MIMAATKLTLKLDEEVIRRGKLYAKSRSTSLSKLVEQVLRQLIAQEEAHNYPYIVEPDAFVSSIGLQEPTLAELDDPIRDRADYYNYLSSKTDE